MGEEKEYRYEIRFAGSGGQGVITAAVVLARAAGVYGGKHVCQTQSYGPEARGGKSKAEVVISNRPIDYPKVIKMDMLIAMNQESCDAYFFDFKPNGMLVVDSDLVSQIPTSRAVAIPFTEIASRETGKKMVANIVALGTTGILCGQTSEKELESAVLATVPAGTEEINLKALRAGISAARAVATEKLPRSITPPEEEEI